MVWTTTTEPAQNKVATLIAFADGLFAHHQVEAVSFFYIVVRFVDFHSLLGRSHGPWKAAGGGGGRDTQRSHSRVEFTDFYLLASDYIGPVLIGSLVKSRFGFVLPLLEGH